MKARATDNPGTVGVVDVILLGVKSSICTVFLTRVMSRDEVGTQAAASLKTNEIFGSCQDATALTD